MRLTLCCWTIDQLTILIHQYRITLTFMKKFSTVVVGCLIVLAAWATLYGLNNRAVVPRQEPSSQSTPDSGDTIVLPGQQQSGDGSTLRTFQWQFAGISFQYPATWSILSWGSSPEVASWIELISSPGGTPKYQPYFCVDLAADPASSDFYQLRNGRVVGNVGSGLFIYQEVLTTAGLPQLKAWLATDERESVIFRPKGKSLFAGVVYRCAGGDADIPTLTAEEQVSSSLYADSLNILRSVAASVSPIGD